MALDFLIIQPILTKYKRLFLATSKMVSGLYINLNTKIITIYQVLRS
jgi:hypothetical protein